MKGIRRTRPEDYLLAIKRICGDRTGVRASTGAIAKEIGVSKGTASTVVKSLSEVGDVDLVPYTGACLTPTGRANARLVEHRYQVIGAFLQCTLHLEEDRAGQEAWCLEPSASEYLVQQMARHLQQEL